LRRALLELRAARALLRRPLPLRERAWPLEKRLVFVVGCPRSGTTFLSGAMGSLPGFVDLGELPPLKASIPRLAALPPQRAARRVRRTLGVVRQLGLVGGLRSVEHTPETSFVMDRVALAFPDAQFVHIVRDGRDVVCSLLEQGWFSADRRGTEDAGFALGPETRFWVEPERADEFPRVSEARRAGWAWRRYVTTARAGGPRLLELRYERMAEDPSGTAAELARFLEVPEEPLARALDRAHRDSIGRYRTDLSSEQLDDVLEESGELLSALGYA
jgi:sulfotransferase family protein